MANNYFYVFEEGGVRDWRYCPICGGEISWVYANENDGHITCSGDHAGDGVRFEVYSEEELEGGAML